MASSILQGSRPGTLMEIEQRRRGGISCEYEDAGLFPDRLCRVSVALTALLSRNERRDILVNGLTGNGLQIIVSFAGRRALAAGPLVRHLRLLQRRQDLSRQPGGPDRRDPLGIRFPAEIEGSWRKTILTDPDGCIGKSYTLVAARWTVPGPTGRAFAFGVLPVR